jgi:hypothetical protein
MNEKQVKGNERIVISVDGASQLLVDKWTEITHIQVKIKLDLTRALRLYRTLFWSTYVHNETT